MSWLFSRQHQKSFSFQLVVWPRRRERAGERERRPASQMHRPLNRSHERRANWPPGSRGARETGARLRADWVALSQQLAGGGAELGAHLSKSSGCSSRELACAPHNEAEESARVSGVENGNEREGEGGHAQARAQMRIICMRTRPGLPARYDLCTCLRPPCAN